MNISKSKTMILMLCFAGSLCVLPGCEREGPAERAGERVDEGTERTGENIDRAGENIQDAAN
jgi:hypothetical protein